MSMLKAVKDISHHINDDFFFLPLSHVIDGVGWE